MCDSGSNTTQSNQSQTTALTGPALDAYNQTFAKATAAANQAYDPATNKNVAGFTAPQNQAFSDVTAAQGIQSPYIAQSVGYTASGAAPISSAQIQNYLDPNTQNVINATQHDFDVSNARQQSGVQGNARIQGSLGGDREAVAQALTAEAQNRTQAPVIAGLRSQAYSQALSAAQTDAQRQLAASGQSLAQGQTAGAAKQVDLANLYASGELQQGQQQKVLDTASANAAQQNAFTYQQPQYLAGITGALGGYGTTTTGTSTTQGPQPNEWAQAGGLALGALSLIPKLAHGGAVDGYADGGSLPDSAGITSYIPTMGAVQPYHAPTLNMSTPKTNSATSGIQDFSSHFNDVTQAAKGFKGLGNGLSGLMSSTSTAPSDGTAFLNPITTTTTPTMDGALSGIGAGLSDAAGSIGTGISGLLAAFSGGGAVPHYDDGGAVPGVTLADAGIDPNLVPPTYNVAQDFAQPANATSVPLSGFSKPVIEGSYSDVTPAASKAVVPVTVPDLPTARVMSAPATGGIGAPYTAAPVETGSLPAPAGIRAPAPAPSKPDVQRSILGELAHSLGVQADLDDPRNKAGIMQMAASLMSGSAAGGKGIGGFLRPLGVAAQQGLEVTNQRTVQQAELDARAQQLQAQAAQLALAQTKSPYEIAHLKAQTDLANQSTEAGKVVTIGTQIDSLGNKIEIKGVYNPTTKSYEPINAGSAIAAANPGAGLTGEDFLKTIDPGIASQIRAAHEGKIAVAPNPRTPQQISFQRMLLQAYPDTDATEYPARMALRKAYEGGGKQFQELQAISTVAGHLHDLKDRASELDNFHEGSLGPLTSAANSALGMYREGQGDPRIDRFNQTAHLVADEMGKAYRGGVVTEGEVKSFTNRVAAAKSPEQMRGIIGDLNELLASKRRALEEGYQTGMRGGKLPAAFSTVNDRTKKLFDEVSDWSNGTAKPEAKSSDGLLTPDIKKPLTQAEAESGKYRPGTPFLASDGNIYAIKGVQQPASTSSTPAVAAPARSPAAPLGSQANPIKMPDKGDISTALALKPGQFYVDRGKLYKAGYWGSTEVTQ